VRFGLQTPDSLRETVPLEVGEMPDMFDGAEASIGRRSRDVTRREVGKRLLELLWHRFELGEKLPLLAPSEFHVLHLRRGGKLPKPRKLGSRNVTPEEEADKAIAALIGL
jgi:hypothetical protein